MNLRVPHTSVPRSPHVLMRSMTKRTAAEVGVMHTAEKTAKASRKTASRIVTLAAILAGAAFGVYCMDSRAGVHRWIFPRVMEWCTDPETGAKLSIKLLKMGLAPRDCVEDDPVLRTELFGKTLTNPIGLAAGFDKQAEAIDGLFDLGFGIVEIGSVTPEPQPGNPQPRMFRLPLDGAVINRLGFNSEGHEPVRERLQARVENWVKRVLSVQQGLVSSVGTDAAVAHPTTLGEAQVFAGYPDITADLVNQAGVPQSLKQDRLLSVNLGKNKTSREDSVTDYVKGVQTLGPYADMLVVNVSSPNTPGLRRLQRRSVLEGLLRDVVVARDKLLETRKTPLPLLVKVAPDLSDSELEDVSDAVENTKVDGIIVSNTTVRRPPGLLSHEHVNETGGLSGPPVKPFALHALSVIYERSQGKIPLIGCGGITSADDALEFAKAGASAVQLYTALAYHGPGLPRRIKDDLAARLRAENTTWSQMVGTGLKKTPVYEPSAVNDVGLYPGAQDAFDRSVASVRHEIEQLRESFGLGGAPATERHAIPFTVEKGEEKYASLLEEAQAIVDDKPVYQESENPHVGVLPQRAPAVPEYLLTQAKEQGVTQGELFQEAVQEATAEPVVPRNLPSSESHTRNVTTASGLTAPTSMPADIKKAKAVLRAEADPDPHRVV